MQGPAKWRHKQVGANHISWLVLLLKIGDKLLLPIFINYEFRTLSSHPGIEQSYGLPIIQQCSSVENGQLECIIPGLPRRLHALRICGGFGWGTNCVPGIVDDTSMFSCIVDCGQDDSENIRQGCEWN